MFGKICMHCNGKGNVAILVRRVCPICGGMGYDFRNPMLGACMQCQGTGMIKPYRWTVCKYCNGNGRHIQ